MDIVTCHSEFGYAERPVGLTWEDRQFEIDTIQAAWRFPGGRCFRVLTQDGRAFELTYFEGDDTWQIRAI